MRCDIPVNWLNEEVPRLQSDIDDDQEVEDYPETSQPRAMPAPDGAICSNRPRGHRLVLVKKDDMHLWSTIKRRVTTDWEGEILADEECSDNVSREVLTRRIPEKWPDRVICHFYQI